MKKACSRRRRGSTLLLFTLVMPTLMIPLVGLGVDATMLYVVQGKLSAAVDGAALGAGRLLGTPADPAEIAGEFVRANFPADGRPGFFGAHNLVKNVNVTLGTTKTIRINATADVPLLFARIFGRATAQVAAAATATKKDTRLVLVIDRSGSMNGSNGSGGTVIQDLKNYAAGFTAKFTNGSDEMGLVVFDGSGVVGYPTTRPWDATTTSTSTGGPDTSFASGGNTDMIHQIRNINAEQGTGMSDALWLAYIELQKAHLKRLAADGTDERQNSIVLFTDGAPTAVSLYLNNPAESNAYNVVPGSSPCANKTITTAEQIATKMMISWVTFAGSNMWGQYKLASTDTTLTAAQWMSSAGADAAAPNSTAYSGCTNVTAGPNSNLPNAFTRIPAIDRYGNSLVGTGYTNSRFIDSNGNVSSAYNGTALDVTQKSSVYHWKLAMWNAVDSAALRIRQDANLANRPGDTQSMNVQIFAIGYLGTGGLDDGLLKRVANDSSSTSFDAMQPRGRYIPASDSTALANAFTQVASSVLRLSQ